MVKRLSVIISFAFLAFSACGSDNPIVDVTEGDDINVSETTEQDIAGEDIVEDTGRTDTVTDLGYLDTNQPDTNQPDMNQPDTNQPDMNQPDMNQPDMNQPDMNQPDDNPIEDLPVEDVPVEDIPVEDVPVEDIPVEDVPVEETEMPWMCAVDDDCADYFDDADYDQCHRPACDTESGECVIIPVDDGTECSDGEFCTAPDTCVAGECIPGGMVTCDDGDACTFDECVGGACVNTPDTTILTCGIGPCYREIPACEAGVVNECVPGEPQAEICDTIDNDCNGFADDNLTDTGAACDSDLLGPCLAGTVACVEGVLSCVPNVQPTAEKCDKQDNDCDGVIDNDPVSNGMPCAVPGQLGNCQVGETGCTNGLVVCVQTNFPEAEKCDGIDNDCDNDIDENSPGAGVACSTGLPGICNDGTTSCATGKLECTQTTFPQTEICDGLDNDCDGVTDPANTTGCTTFFKDVDGDGFGSAETACLCAAVAPFNTIVGGDCCDTDSRAKPVGAAPYTTQNNCNSWDYNCDGTVTRQYNYGDGSCGGLLFCKQDMVEGWKGAAPNCGEVGTFLENCTLEFIPPVCQETTKKLTQGCF